MPDARSSCTRPTTGLGRWIKDPYCGLSHATGAVLSLVGMIVLLALTTGGASSVVGLTIYGLSLVALFTASALAHSLHVDDRTGDWLDRVDYACIFFLIAGTYTPLCLTALRGPWGYTMLSVEGTLALVGASAALLTRLPTKYLSPLYVPMSWLVMIAAGPMFRAVPPRPMALLLVGGVVYSVGALVFIFEKPRLWPGRFGWHDLWHTMVLTGAACHFAAVAMIAL